MNRIISKYRICYENGIVQEKDLISHKDYETIIKPKQVEIHELKVDKENKKANEIKAELFDMFGDNWFTDESPLYKAHQTGSIEPYGIKCKLEKI